MYLPGGWLLWVRAGTLVAQRLDLDRKSLAGDPVTLGRTWAFNVVRTLPGRGVQAFSLPADVQPRPEGMGLLLFMKEKEGIQQAVKPQPATPRGN